MTLQIEYFIRHIHQGLKLTSYIQTVAVCPSICKVELSKGFGFFTLNLHENSLAKFRVLPHQSNAG